MTMFFKETKRAARRATALCCLVFFGLAMSANAAVLASFRDPSPRVSTVAGNGNAGTSDGDAQTARFMTPTGIAVDRKSGTIYVADSAADQIRAIDPHGLVTTLAGTPVSVGMPLRDRGGYRDGPARAARFNTPTGVAVAPDGSIYVADSGNHCVRRIAGGMVTTMFGQPTRAGHIDGPLATAAFQEPRAIAISKDGTVFVADYGSGIRSVKSGVVGTLPIPVDHATKISDISLWDGDGPMLFYVTGGQVGRFDLAGHVDSGAPSGGSGGVMASGVVALTDRVFAATSASIHTVFMSGWQQNWRVVTGAATRDTGTPGTFRDGSPAEARFDTPLGISAAADGTLVIADAGNRRVRSISPVNVRNSDSPPPDFDPSVYRIVYVSNSYSFANSMWDDSTAGTIEKRLNDNRAALGSTKTFSVRALNLGNDLTIHQQYIEQILALDATDLVIWSVNPGMFVKDFDPIWVFRPPDLSASNLARIKTLMTHSAGVLKAAGKSVVIADQPFGSQVPPTESVVYREYAADTATVQDRDTVLRFDYGNFDVLETFLDNIGLPHFGSYKAFLDVEKKPHAPLWALDEEGHFSPIGSMFYGDLLASYLMKIRPWANSPAATSVKPK